MKKTLSVLIMLALLGLVAAATLPAQKEAAPKLKGTITISGAWALYPMVVKWAEEFRKLNPDVRFDISAGGAGKGLLTRWPRWSTSAWSPARSIRRGAKRAWFIPVTKTPWCRSSTRITPVRGDPEKGGQEIRFRPHLAQRRAADLERAPRGRSGAQVHVYTRSDSCGAAETWALFMGKKQEDCWHRRLRRPGLNEAVRKDELGIGFNNINYAYDATTLKPMAGTAILPLTSMAMARSMPTKASTAIATPSPRPSPRTSIPARRRGTSTWSARASPRTVWSRPS